MMTADVAPGDLNSPYHVLRRDIEAYVASPPKGHRFISPVVDWHHPDEYSQQGVQGLSKFLSQVTKECNILDEVSLCRSCRAVLAPALYVFSEHS